jgi:hypothetical protein
VDIPGHAYTFKSRRLIQVWLERITKLQLTIRGAISRASERGVSKAIYRPLPEKIFLVRASISTDMVR